jgi:hypothetical protein
MSKKPETRKAPDPVFAAIAEHKVLIKEYIRCRNNSQAARASSEKKHGKSLKGLIAAADDARPEYNQFCRAGEAEREAGMRMARTKPTTPAGAAALIAHTRHEIEAGSGRENWEDWVPTALKTVAAALTRTEGA